jgi:putative spermidine/putrescine transport system substrate-binding protein
MNRQPFSTSFLRGAGYAIALCAFTLMHGAACAQQKEFEGTRIVVNGFGGNLDDVLVENVSKVLKDRYGIIVEIVPGSVASAYAKAMTSRSNPAFDVLITDDITLRAAAKADLIEEVSAADVPNMAQLYPNFIPLGGYGLPFFASVCALTYNKEHVKTPPQALSDLANPELKGRVGIFNLESVGGVVSLISLADANGGSIQNVDPGFAKLKEIAPNLATATSSPVELYNLLQRGEIWASWFWSGRVNALIDQGAPLATAVPKEKLRGNLDFVSLVKGTKSRGAALKFMDQITSAQTSLAIARSVYFGPTNKTVTLPPEIQKRVLPYGAEMIASMPPVDWDAVVAKRAGWIERWNREMR